MQSGYTKKGIYYSKLGLDDTTADVIIFLHGLGSSQNFYYSIAKKLSNKYTCLLLDNEGAARSKLSDVNLTIRTHAENIVGLINELGLNNRLLNIVGHSMSGMTVNYISANFSETLKINKTVLLCPVHPFENHVGIFQGRINAVKESQSLSEIANGVAKNAVGSKCSYLSKGFIRELVLNQSIEGYIANCYAIVDAAVRDEEYRSYYKAINNPVLMIIGGEDKVCPWENCTQVIAENTKNMKIVSLEGIGHWIAIESDIEVYNVINEFL